MNEVTYESARLIIAESSSKALNNQPEDWFETWTKMTQEEKDTHNTAVLSRYDEELKHLGINYLEWEDESRRRLGIL